MPEAVSSPSVIIRTKNSAGTLEKAFETVRSQTVSVQIVVVDSGSTDATLALAQRHADVVVELPAAQFSYGRALNAGAEGATGEIHIALSSHCWLERADWVERAVALYARDDVAGASGTLYDRDGRPLFESVYQTANDAYRNPLWGFSNHAGSWRASVWRQHRFNEEMEACEDKEWAWRVLNSGHTIALHPALTVSSKHRERSGTRALFERSRREARSLAPHVPVSPRSAREALATWWNQVPEEPIYPPLYYRLNYLRAAEIIGRYVGQAEARRNQT